MYKKTLDRTSRVFLHLLCSGLWARKIDSSIFEGLSARQWSEIYTLAKRQSVTGVCFAALETLPPHLQPELRILLQWYGQSQYIRATNGRMMAIWGDLNAMFREAGLSPILIKGLTLASYYSDAQLRMAGDIDIYLGQELGRATEILQKQGVDVKCNPNHSTLKYRGVAVELHDRVAYLPDIALSVSDSTIFEQKHLWRELEPNVNALMLLGHSASHLMGPGVGLRHLCDWCRFIYCNRTVIDFGKLDNDIQAIGLGRFSAAFSAIGVEYLGADFLQMTQLGQSADKRVQNALLNDMLLNGDCGKETIKHRGENYKLGHYVSILRRLMEFYPIAPLFAQKMAASKLRNAIKDKL